MLPSEGHVEDALSELPLLGSIQHIEGTGSLRFWTLQVIIEGLLILHCRPWDTSNWMQCSDEKQALSETYLQNEVQEVLSEAINESVVSRQQKYVLVVHVVKMPDNRAQTRAACQAGL